MYYLLAHVNSLHNFQLELNLIIFMDVCRIKLISIITQVADQIRNGTNKLFESWKSIHSFLIKYICIHIWLSISKNEMLDNSD